MVRLILEDLRYSHSMSGRLDLHILPAAFEITLQWSHNEHDGVSNYQRIDCLLNRLFRWRSNEISKLRVTGLCEGNSPMKMFPFDDVIMRYDLFNVGYSQQIPLAEHSYCPTEIEFLAFSRLTMKGYTNLTILTKCQLFFGSTTLNTKFNHHINTLRPRQNGRNFADDIFKCIFFNEMFQLRLKFHWRLFIRVQLTIIQHCFR